MKSSALLLDSNGQVVASRDAKAFEAYKMLRTSQSVYHRYQLGKCEDGKAFNHRLDLAITGLEDEVRQKTASVKQLV